MEAKLKTYTCETTGLQVLHCMILGMKANFNEKKRDMWIEAVEKRNIEEPFVDPKAKQIYKQYRGDRQCF